MPGKLWRALSPATETGREKDRERVRDKILDIEIKNIRETLNKLEKG